MKSALRGLTVLVGMTGWAHAQDNTDIPAAPIEPRTATTDANPHPEIPIDSEWAQSLVILILGMFAAAALVGSVYKMPAPAPVAHDDHGHGHDDHGHSDHGHAPAHGH